MGKKEASDLLSILHGSGLIRTAIAFFSSTIAAITGGSGKFPTTSNLLLL